MVLIIYILVSGRGLLMTAKKNLSYYPRHVEDVIGASSKAMSSRQDLRKKIELGTGEPRVFISLTSSLCFVRLRIVSGSLWF